MRRTGSRAQSSRHLGHNPLAHGAKFLDRFARHTKGADFLLIRIGNVASNKYFRGTRNIGDLICQKTARAWLGQRQSLLRLRKQTDKNGRQSLIARAEDRVAQFFANNFLGLRDCCSATDNAYLNLTRTRAITEFDSLNGEDQVANFFLNDRFAHVGNAKSSHRGLLRSGGDPTQNRRDEIAEHGLQLARRPRQQKQVRRWNAWIYIRRQIEAGRSPILVRQNVRPRRNQCLPPDPFRGWDSARRESAANPFPDDCVLGKRQLQIAGHYFACDVITRRTEPARHKNNLGP